MQTQTNAKTQVIEKLKGVLIVSCQANSGEPLALPVHIKAMALSAINGGAKGLRLEGIENIRTVKGITNVPIIGLSKSKEVEDSERLSNVYITATFAEARSLAAAGCDIIALDATARPRRDNLPLEETISRIRNQLGKMVVADISSLEEGIKAEAAGADFISTTLYGYTKETELPKTAGPGLSLLKDLVARLKIPVILEGRVWHPEEVRTAFEYGAHAVVVGSAITRPQLITERFVQAIPK